MAVEGEKVSVLFV